MNLGENPTLNEEVEPNNELKTWLINYVGEKVGPESGQVTVENIIEVMASDFPEFLMAVAEENWIRGYHQGLVDVEEGKKPFERLPALNLHKEKYKDEYGLKDLRAGARKERMSMEDVLFLAGFDPETKQLIGNLPIHGKMEGPIIGLDILSALEN